MGYSDNKHKKPLTPGQIRGIAPGKFDRQHIVNKIKNSCERERVKDVIKKIGSGKSVQKIGEAVRREHGIGMQKKFLKQAEQYYEPREELTEAQKKANIYLSRKMSEELDGDNLIQGGGVGFQNVKGLTGFAGDTKKRNVAYGTRKSLSEEIDEKKTQILKSKSTQKDLGIVGADTKTGFAGNITKKKRPDAGPKMGPGPSSGGIGGMGGPPPSGGGGPARLPY